MRKQRRKAEQQDKQDRVRMGLIPPDPPKGLCFGITPDYGNILMLYSIVRLANLMRVLTSDAVQDPTKVEARVRREVAMRRLTHDRANAEAKLTDEQRKEKIENKKVEEEKKGIYGAVYKSVVLFARLKFHLIDAYVFCLVGSKRSATRATASKSAKTQNRWG